MTFKEKMENLNEGRRSRILFGYCNIVCVVCVSSTVDKVEEPSLLEHIYIVAGKIQFFFPPTQCHHMPFVDFVVLPPGHGRSVTDF